MNSKIIWQLAVTLVPAILLLAVLAMVSVFFQVSMPSITRDVTAIAKIHPLAGFLSNLGIFLWCATASISLLAAMVLRNFKQVRLYWFLLCSALLSVYLMFDDAFMFHEKLASSYLGVDEKVIMGILGVAVIAYFSTFRRTILETNYCIIIVASGLLALSVVIDIILSPWLGMLGHWEYFIEDGIKWLGIVSWFSYFANTSYLFTIQVIRMNTLRMSPASRNTSTETNSIGSEETLHSSSGR